MRLAVSPESPLLPINTMISHICYMAKGRACPASDDGVPAQTPVAKHHTGLMVQGMLRQVSAGCPVRSDDGNNQQCAIRPSAQTILRQFCDIAVDKSQC